MFCYRKIIYQEKKEDEEANLRIDCDMSSHPEGFFFNLRQKQESVSSFFFNFLLPSYTLYNIPQLYLSEGEANILKKKTPMASNQPTTLPSLGYI